MRELRITSLQWSVGVFCVVLGLLILVVSQQLNAPALAALQPYRLELGCWLTLSGLALFTVAALRAGRALTAGGTAMPRDFTSIVGGTMATLYGLFVILLPERLGVALEPANRSLVTG